MVITLKKSTYKYHCRSEGSGLVRNPLIHLYRKIIWTGLSAFEWVKPLMQCGPIALPTRKRLHQFIWITGVRLYSEYSKFYKNSSIGGKVFQKTVRIWKPLCCSTAVHKVMFYHEPLNSGRKFLLSLKKNDAEIPRFLPMQVFLIKLAYLFNIYENFNSLNLFLQGKNTHLLRSIEKKSAFIRELKLWRRKLNEGTRKDFFVKWTWFFSKYKNDIWRALITANFDKLAWIQDAFDTSSSKLVSAEKENLIESLKAKFSTLELREFLIEWTIKN